MLITDTMPGGDQPFSALSEDELQLAKKAAEANLARQRTGIEMVEGEKQSGEVECEGIRIAPKTTGSTTVGPPWDGEALLSKQG